MNSLTQVFILAMAVLLLAATTGLAFFLPMMFLILPFVAVPLGLLAYIVYANQKLVRDAQRYKITAMIPRLSSTYAAASAGTAYAEPSQDLDFEMQGDARIEALRSLSESEQIEAIESHELPLVLEYMPIGHEDHRFHRDNRGQWHFRFQFTSAQTSFRGFGVGSSPIAAFLQAKHVLIKQIQTWHKDRTAYEGNIKSAAETADQKKRPCVLIIEDDIDVAVATAQVFSRLGCETMISNGRDAVHQRMSFADIDFIVMDWILDENLRADEIVDRSSRIIDAFSDLREKFSQHQAKVITFSALNRSQVALPHKEFFSHVDHWEKPVQYNELTDRASELLVANGF